MADFVFNVAKGRAAELYNRVDTNDPANSALIVVILKTSGLESDATIKTYATLDAVLKRGTGSQVAEIGNTIGGDTLKRKTLTDSDISAIAPGATMDLDTGDLTWTTVATGDGWSKLLFCYDNDTTSGTDTSIIPITAHDFVVVPDGSDIIASVNVFFRAS